MSLQKLQPGGRFVVNIIRGWELVYQNLKEGIFLHLRQNKARITIILILKVETACRVCKYYLWYDHTVFIFSTDCCQNIIVRCQTWQRSFISHDELFVVTWWVISLITSVDVASWKDVAVVYWQSYMVSILVVMDAITTYVFGVGDILFYVLHVTVLTISFVRETGFR